MTSLRLNYAYLVGSLSIIILCLLPSLVYSTATNNATLSSSSQDDSIIKALSFNQGSLEYNLGQYLEVFEDPNAKITINQITKKLKPTNFIKTSAETPFFGYTQSAIWVRFKFSDGFPQTNPWYIALAAPALSNVELYVPFMSDNNFISNKTTSDNKTLRYHQLISGSDHSIKSRNVIDSDIAFKLEKITPNHYYYFRITSATNVFIPLTLMSQDAFNSGRSAYGNALGFYYGGMLILIIYNLFFYLFNRSKDLLIYVAYLACMFWYQLIVDGLAMRYLWPNSPELNSFQSPAMFMVILFCSQFGRNFLRLRETWPLGDTLLRITCYVAIILFCFSWFLPLHLMNPLSSPMGLTVCILLACAGIYAWIKGFRPARFFVIAWAMFIGGSALILARNLHILPHSTLTQYGLHFGSLLEAVFLSFALADRINQIKREKETVEQDSKHKLEEANKTLSENAITLRDTLEQLKKSNQLKDDFLLSISHELRTPINGIQGSLNLLKESNIESQQSEYINIAEKSTDDLMNLISSILELNSLNQNMMMLREDEMSLFGLLDNCVKSIRPLCESKNISIDMSNLLLPEIVLSDRARLRHVFMNLLSNAVKFTEKGSITISSVTHKHDNGIYDFELIFKDTGIGIPQDKLHSVFEAFIQADSGYTRKHGGVGIGLNICKLIVEKMGGKIIVASIPKKGSTFIIRLPLKVPQDVSVITDISKAKPVAEPTPRVERRKTIRYKSVPIKEKIERTVNVLIVEDIPVNQLLLKKALEKLGMQTTLAVNGLEAVDIIQTREFNVILMDCQMPVMDGFEATRQIRDLEKRNKTSNKHTPIIAVTANAMPGDKEKCIAAGMDDYIAKPYQISQLDETLSKHIKKKSKFETMNG